MCKHYDAGECIEPGCEGRVTCHDFDRRCVEHDINGRGLKFEDDERRPPLPPPNPLLGATLDDEPAVSLTTGPPRSLDRWADVEVGQRWRSRDRRDQGRIVYVEEIAQEHVVVRSVRASRVSKRLFHRLYERAANV